ncbi:hypothetical protein CAPTEDRAFT_220647 [Capitella teleta]|uniref:Uncharacterized protein n=1 Tax=Capitella teleta TaxID=283909 RepID=R7T4M3_CAPTE|nr:hypothetical protein CAPTEDRAFT_220647 [Capitella teleta]|eukprot:ELT87781.1 hypothetical protein CAPTEDRAFT_220647 [Capitella teleta]
MDYARDVREPFIVRVNQFPAEMAAIDFNMYRSKLASPALVETMEKGFKSMTIPYPKDQQNLKAAIDAQEKVAAEESKARVKALTEFIGKCNDVVVTLDKLPPQEQITYQVFYEYFPDSHENLQESFLFHDEYHQGDLSENNPYGRGNLWGNWKTFASRAKKYIPGIPAEAKYKPPTEAEKKRTAYMDQLDAGH